MVATLIIVAVINGIASCIAAYIAHKTHKAVNSRWDEFVKMAEKSFRAEGAQQEREDEQKRRDLKQ